MITYNHADYILEAIQGVLKQKTKYPIELIISNDCSTDLTDSVIRNIITTYDGNVEIRYFNQTQNMGMKSNFEWALKKVKGKYIALCDGDDFWINDAKIENQVNFLETNTEYSICFHAVEKYDQLNDVRTSQNIVSSEEFPKDKILLASMLHTVSFVFKSEHLANSKVLSNNETIGGDRLIAIMMAEAGKLFFMKDEMAVYRIHPQGVSNSDQKHQLVKYHKRFIRQYIYILKVFKSQEGAARIKIVDHSLTIAFFYYNKRDIRALYYSALALYYQPSLIIRAIKRITKK